MKRIVDTSQIDTDNPLIRNELDIDLRRMNRLDHSEAPDGADAYRVVVKPSSATYSEFLHRFIFEIQYGKFDGGEFIPLGEVLKKQTETLPFL